MSSTTRLLEAQVAASEQKLSDSLTELAEVARNTVDVRAQVKKHPLVGFGLALAVGVAAGAMMGAPRRRRPRVTPGDGRVEQMDRPRVWEPAAHAIMGIVASQAARVSHDLLDSVMHRYLRSPRDNRS